MKPQIQRKSAQQQADQAAPQAGQDRRQVQLRGMGYDAQVAALSPRNAVQLQDAGNQVATSIQHNGQTYYTTRAEAEQNVDGHVSPSNCFVWNDGPTINGTAYPWRVIPGTGCAHWVAHELGIQANPGCFDGFAIRVSQVATGASHALAQAAVGDIWTNNGGTHTGLVRALNTDATGAVTSAQVEHCSSGQGGVVTGNFATGLFYTP